MTFCTDSLILIPPFAKPNARVEQFEALHGMALARLTVTGIPEGTTGRTRSLTKMGAGLDQPPRIVNPYTPLPSTVSSCDAGVPTRRPLRQYALP